MSTCSNHSLSLFHSTQSLFFNGEHASVPKKPHENLSGLWRVPSPPWALGIFVLIKGPCMLSEPCHLWQLRHKRIINRMSTLCGSWGQLGDIVQFLPEVCRPGDAFFRAAGQCDIAAHVQGPLDSAKRGRRRNCERRGEGDSKSGNVTKQWNAGSLWTCSDGESKDSGMSCQGDKNEAADKSSLWFAG